MCKPPLPFVAIDNMTRFDGNLLRIRVFNYDDALWLIARYRNMYIAFSFEIIKRNIVAAMVLFNMRCYPQLENHIDGLAQDWSVSSANLH